MWIYNNVILHKSLGSLREVRVSWINVVTERHKIKNDVDHFISNLSTYKNASRDEILNIDYTLLVSAVIAYGENIPAQLLNFFTDTYKRALLSNYKLVFGNPVFLQSILPITILETVSGNDQNILWKDILNYKPDSEVVIQTMI